MHVDVLSRSRRGADDGLSLVELLVSVTILGIVLAAVVGVSFVSARTTAASRTRLADSNDLVRAASYFGDDVADAQGVSVAAEPLCGTDDEVVVEFAGQDVADDGPTVTTTVVSWVLRPVDEESARLHRLSCSAASATPDYPLTPVTDEPVAVVQTADEAAVSCAGGCGAGFTQVSLTVTGEGGLSFTLSGRRRTTP